MAKKKKVEKPPECVDLWPYLTIKLYLDGSAGWCGLKHADRDHVDRELAKFEADLRRKLDILERWKKGSPGKVELRA